jgi:hypothetical protein
VAVKRWDPRNALWVRNVADSHLNTSMLQRLSSTWRRNVSNPGPVTRTWRRPFPGCRVPSPQAPTPLS